MSLNIDIQGNLLPNLLTMITQLLATLLIFLMFKKFLWKPVREILAKRSSAMQGELDTARKYSEEARADLASAKEEIEKAKESSRQILRDARKEADALSKKIVKSAEETAQNKLTEAEERIALREKEANDAFREKTVDVAMDAVKKLMEEKADEKTDYEILKQFIEEESKDR